MDTHIFIMLAYAVAGVLLAGLCLTTWYSSRRINAQIQQRDGQ